MFDGEIYLADSATTHTIFRNKRYFLNLNLIKANVNTISGPLDIIEGTGRAIIILTKDMKLDIYNALYSPKSKINLLGFKDIRRNNFHLETMNENNIEYLYITSNMSRKKEILEKLPAFSSGLYYSTIKSMKSYTVIKDKLYDLKFCMLWHDRLGHPGSIMMHRIIENSHGHSLKNLKILLSNENSCTTCSQGKLIVRPSLIKLILNLHHFYTGFKEIYVGLFTH